MMSADTKKDGHIMMEIHYNTSRHEHTPRGEGASEGCRPKLPRWPFSAPAAPWLRALPWIGVWYGTRLGTSSFLCAASDIFLPTSPTHLIPSGLPAQSLRTHVLLLRHGLWARHTPHAAARFVGQSCEPCLQKPLRPFRDKPAADPYGAAISTMGVCSARSKIMRPRRARPAGTVVATRAASRVQSA
jgi:hypothetical protein